MNNIEKAAKEYAKKGFFNHCEPEYIAKMGFKAGANHRQKEIDGLKERVVQLEKQLNFGK